MAKEFDVVVIGAGPGGYVAAIRAAQLGFKTAVVEREHLGGICLNWGCIPTKALLKASELYRSFQHADEFGFKHNGVSVDPKKLIGRSRDVAGQLSKGVGFLMKKNKIEVIDGEGAFKDDTTLTVKNGKKEDEVKFKYAIIATGARARTIPGVLEADGKNIWTYKEAMVPEKLPKSLLIIGAGAIGVEFASFYATLGTDVTIVEAQDRLVPVEDHDSSKLLKKELEKQKLAIKTSSNVKSLKAAKSGIEAEIESDGKSEKIKAEKALIAIGVQGNVEGLNLDFIGVREERGAIQTDDFYRTNRSNVYAIGDVAGTPWLAHVASHEGIIAVEHIAHTEGKGDKPHPMDYDSIPGCTYCTPQIGSVGLTEQQAKDRGLDVKIGRYNYQANGKALAIGEPEGFVKTIFDAKSGELLGAHIVGAEATEMISTFVIAKQLESTEQDIIHACLPHPTLSEMVGESVLDSQGRVLNA